VGCWILRGSGRSRSADTDSVKWFVIGHQIKISRMKINGRRESRRTRVPTRSPARCGTGVVGRDVLEVPGGDGEVYGMQESEASSRAWSTSLIMSCGGEERQLDDTSQTYL
jgi:hypothetical protein